MSQSAPKSQRPTLSLNAQLVGNIKNKPRSNTPSSTTEKSDSRSSTPAQQLIDAESQNPSPKGKRRVSNDSAKVRASPKPATPVIVVVDDVETEKNGHTNGTNGAHVEGNGVEKKEVTPKNNKKDSNTEKANGKKDKEETVKATPEKKQKNQDNALVHGEKTQPEMEKLVLEPDTPADSPMPKSIGKSPGRILKYTPGKGRVSPFKTATERLQNASTIVNLSTVSEQSTESASVAASPAVAYDSPVKPPTGRVSGRRNTRPINEIKMLRPKTTANDSTSSTTANLGSPVHNDSLRTPIISRLIGRKRAGTPERDDIHVDSPSKRARIDFSGFLGYVTTPISNLKNRLSRIGLTSSTPRALEMEDDIVNVSAMETEQNATDKKDVSQAVEASESVVEKEIEEIKADNADKLTENTEVPPTPPRRQSVCNIM